MLKEFKEFIAKGNLVEIAVGLILASGVRGLGQPGSPRT